MPKKPTSSFTSTPVSTPREALHDILRTWDPAAGATGFEGLVADALAAFTGYTFRLAKSGSQFGRDAATTAGRFAIAMEAKRYTKSVPLQELVGKSTLAAFALAEGVDLWVLAATVEVGETTERQLEQILDEGGISLLTLDWTSAGLPPLPRCSRPSRNGSRRSRSCISIPPSTRRSPQAWPTSPATRFSMRASRRSRASSRRVCSA